MLQVVVGELQAAYLVVLNQKAKQFQSHQIYFTGQKNGKLLPIVVAPQSRKFAFFFLPEHQSRVNGVACLFAYCLIVFLKGFFRSDQCFELIGECSDESIDFLYCLGRECLVLPEGRGLENGNDFWIEGRNTFWLISFFLHEVI